MMGKILTVDDDPIFLQVTKVLLEERGFIVDSAVSGEAGMKKIIERSFDIVMTDLDMSPMNGIDFLRAIRAVDQDVIVLMVTGHSSVETAVEAMRLGADDYIVKPWTKDSGELFLRLEKLMEKRRVKSDRQILQEEKRREFLLDRFVGKTSQMQKIFKLIHKVAPSDATILILGETGTGKELVAQALHQLSPRRERPLVVVNCPAYSENLFESELFGHEKGSFTGADKQKQGRFEIADGSSLFIDEVGDLPQSTQAKLLRFLQERKFERVGGTETVETDVRVIAATNCDLEKLVKDGKFRQDLFYRLNVVPISLPPLRERNEDIPILVDFFLEKSNIRFHRNVKSVSEPAMEILLKYLWPGNVRELENMVERAVLLEESDTITTFPLPHLEAMESDVKNSVSLDTSSLEAFPTYDDYVVPLVSKIEKEYLSELMMCSKGNIKKALEKAGVSRNTVYRKMKEYGLDKWSFKGS